MHIHLRLQKQHYYLVGKHCTGLVLPMAGTGDEPLQIRLAHMIL